MKEIIKLVRPITHEGEEIKEIRLDFDSLTGGKLIEVERQFLMASPLNEGVSIKEYSKEYQALVAAKISNYPIEVFHQLGGRDFSNVTIMVQNFFIGAVLAE